MTLQQTKGTRSKSSGKPCFESLDEAIAVDSPPIAQPHEVAFWLIAYVFAATMLGTTLPTPLDVIWESQWHFSSGTVNLIFAVYAAGVLSALVFAGRASDQVGRRPVSVRITSWLSARDGANARSGAARSGRLGATP